MFDTITSAIGTFLIATGISPSHLVAGIAGAFVRTVIQGKRLSWELVSACLVGALCAMYLTPLVAKWFGIGLLDVSTINGLAFAIGMLGLSLAEGAFKIAHRWATNPRLPRSIDAEGFADALNDEPPKPRRRNRRPE
ncbi:hypothetical protein JZX86_27590 [Agrobacterium rosae]|uniref:hypothetical protein n=1 Tax=Agrobacterium rosae TaxID=1972867 RepID=UPI0019D404B0|nr:hypothetical protein [Agrobacterium rosae]MBN7809086.1 hypothetical protein [Agrobacterium rosae]